MNRRQIGIVAGVVVVLGAAVFVVCAAHRRAAYRRAAPEWLNPHQPPDGVAAQLSTLNADESWAANRGRHMSACCAPYTAGRRLRRTYPASLEESPDSCVRGGIALEAKLGC